MRQMVIDLDNKQQRPVAVLDSGLAALVDTGAYIPVWVDDETVLADHMRGKMVKKGVSFTGFGGTARGNLYQATVQIGSLIYPDMHIVANSELDAPFNMILSATMFQNLIYEIDDRNHKLNISVPDEESMVRNLKIRDSNGKIYVLCNSISDSTQGYGILRTFLDFNGFIFHCNC